MSTFFKRHQRVVIWAVVVAFVVGGVGLFSLDRAGLFSGSEGGGDSGRPTFAASVDGDRISLEALDARATELANRYRSLLAQYGQDTSNLFSGTAGAMLRLRLQSGAMTELIRETVYVQEAKRRGIRVADATIDQTSAQEYESFLTSNGITEETLKAYLEANGSSLESYKASIRSSVATNLLIQAVDAEIGVVPDPTELELGVYFEKNIARYDQSEEVQASHILVSDRAEADALKAELDAGASFAELAASRSLDAGSRASGGDLGWFGRGQMVREFEDAAFGAAIGVVTEPVETTYGFHLIVVRDRHEAGTPTLAEVRGDVAADYKEEMRTALVEDWLALARAARTIQIEIAILKAFAIQEQDIDAGLAEFERLRREGGSDDPYMAYYIGQIYESKAAIAASERVALEAIAEPTSEQTARIATLVAEERDAKGNALAAYLSMAEANEADESMLNRILSLDPGNTTATLQLSRRLAERGDSAGAQARYSEILANDPESRAALLASGDLAQKDGNHVLARERYVRALDLQPRDVGTLVKLVAVLLAVEDIDGAEEAVAAIRAADPQGARLTVAEGDVALARLSRADVERDTLAAKSSRSSAEDVRLAALQTEISALYQTAVDKIEAGLRAGGGIDLNVKLAQAHLLAGALDAAEKEFKLVLARSPYRADAYEGMAEVHLERGRTDEALEALRTALARSFVAVQRIRIAESILALDVADTATRTRLAKLYADQGRWAAAIGEYGRLLAADPTIEEAYAGIASAYSAQQDYSTALEYLLRGVRSVQRDTAKIRLLEQIVTTDQTDVGLDQPYSSAGLDALIQIAELQLDRGNSTEATTRLEQVRRVDPTYRADDVEALYVRATGASPQ